MPPNEEKHHGELILALPFTGRYFGEKPSDNDKQSYCNRFCDVCKNPQEVMAATQALQPEELVASQMPQIRSEVEEEWDGQENVDVCEPLSRSTSFAESEDGPPPVRVLPGFAKASDLHKKRSVIELEDDDDDDQEGAHKLEDQLFPEEEKFKDMRESPMVPSESANQTHDGQVWVPRKRLNRDLSRHNSASTSHTILNVQTDVNAPQVLDCTPRVTGNVVQDNTADDFWAQPAAIVERPNLSKRTTDTNAIPLSPPRAPMPKPTIAYEPPSQPRPSRCKSEFLINTFCFRSNTDTSANRYKGHCIKNEYS